MHHINRNPFFFTSLFKKISGEFIIFQFCPTVLCELNYLTNCYGIYSEFTKKAEVFNLHTFLWLVMSFVGLSYNTSECTIIRFNHDSFQVEYKICFILIRNVFNDLGGRLNSAYTHTKYVIYDIIVNTLASHGSIKNDFVYN